jgi:large subunit ribosomal protein L18
MATRLEGRARRKRRIRKKIEGTSERPRLTVFRSAKHIYAQVVDDLAGQTLAAASSVGRERQGTGKVAMASAVGEAVAAACAGKKIVRIVFDRNGYLYHGRVKALADGARKGGLEF